MIDYKFPEGITPRDEQKQFIEEAISHWKDKKVMVVQSPTATGKTFLQMALARYAAEELGKSVAIIVPDNVIVEQYVSHFPDVKVLHKRSSYTCDVREDKQCATARTKRCKGCVFNNAVRDAQRSNIVIMNYHTYMSHKLEKHVVIVDEAHKLVDMLSGMKDIKMPRCKYKYPRDIYDREELVGWIIDQTAQNEQEEEFFKKCLNSLLCTQQDSAIQYEKMMYDGEMTECLHIKPTTTRVVPHTMWKNLNKRVGDRLILMSATISDVDIRELNLDHYRTAYIAVESPIPTSNRRVIYNPQYRYSYTMPDSIYPTMAKAFESVLDQHKNQKGVIHLTYNLAAKLQPYMTNKRYRFHTKDSKKLALNAFKASPPIEGAVFVASGLTEGVDLKDDLARFQIIGHVPFISLRDTRIIAKLQKNQKWYAWEAIKRLVQQAGRVCRSPDDYGYTYILDTMFATLIQSNADLFPAFFKDALMVENVVGKKTVTL